MGARCYQFALEAVTRHLEPNPWATLLSPADEVSWRSLHGQVCAGRWCGRSHKAQYGNRIIISYSEGSPIVIWSVLMLVGFVDGLNDESVVEESVTCDVLYSKPTRH